MTQTISTILSAAIIDPEGIDIQNPELRAFLLSNLTLAPEWSAEFDGVSISCHQERNTAVGGNCIESIVTIQNAAGDGQTFAAAREIDDEDRYIAVLYPRGAVEAAPAMSM